MKIKLGIELINAIDDGGITLSTPKGYQHKIPPVLSVEVYLLPFIRGDEI
jgi:hypothetical protein